MSTAFAIAGVTAVLQALLVEVCSNSTSTPFSGSMAVTVSCLAPDQVQAQRQSQAGQAGNQLNLFLHQVTRNAGWRNVDLPSLDADGKTRLSNPPLALDLHYLLTVYAEDPFVSEALLGYALMLFHNNPVLTRAQIGQMLVGLTANPGLPSTWPPVSFLGVVQSSGIAEQIEMLNIVPETLGREEMAWLWTALKADYRLTYPFQVTVTLMSTPLPVTTALPVLRRRLRVSPFNPAQIVSIVPSNQQTATSAQTVTVTGLHLGAVTQVVLANTHFGIRFTQPVTVVNDSTFTFTPDPTLTQPAGTYDLIAQALDNGEVVQSTYAVPFILAPSLATQNATVTALPAGKRIAVSFTPPAQPGQRVALALSDTGGGATPFSATAPADNFTNSAGTLNFTFPSTLPTGAALLASLQVDGVPSPVNVSTSFPPQFQGPMVTPT